MSRTTAIVLTLLLALSGCGNLLYCGPGAGDSHARDMIRGFCSEL